MTRFLLSLAPAIILLATIPAFAADPTTSTAPAATRPHQLKTDIEYARIGDTSLKLDVFVPDDPGPHPVAIIIHGGGWSGGDKAQDITPLFAPLQNAGFVWFSINYRLAPANRWPACFDDVQTALAWIKAHAADYKGDPNRLVLMGHSAGGHLACLAAELAPTKVLAVAVLAPVTDFEQDLAQRGGLSTSLQNLLDRPKEVTDDALKILREMGPIHHVQPGLPPFLILQGSADKTVPPQQSANFQAKLAESHVPCDLITVKDAPHRITDWDKTDATWEDKMTAWLKKVVADKKANSP